MAITENIWLWSSVANNATANANAWNRSSLQIHERIKIQSVRFKMHKHERYQLCSQKTHVDAYKFNDLARK